MDSFYSIAFYRCSFSLSIISLCQGRVPSLRRMPALWWWICWCNWMVSLLQILKCRRLVSAFPCQGRLLYLQHHAPVCILEDILLFLDSFHSNVHNITKCNIPLLCSHLSGDHGVCKGSKGADRYVIERTVYHG